MEQQQPTSSTADTSCVEWFGNVCIGPRGRAGVWTGGADPTPRSDYTDRKAKSAVGDAQKYAEVERAMLRNSSTVYVGNLSFYTSETQVRDFFTALCGPVRRVHMGLNSVTRRPAGFCLVEFADQAGAFAAVHHASGMTLDDRAVRVAWDRGGDIRRSGRFWARGYTGAQTRDEYRQDVDLGRGGVGTRVASEFGIATRVVASAARDPDAAIVTYDWLPHPDFVRAAPGAEHVTAA
jgi:nuclear cap-binding protein subunit 2